MASFARVLGVYIALGAFGTLGSSCASSGAVGTDDAAAAAITPDMACPRFACAVETKEDCQGCFEHLGTCCYGDTTWKGSLTALDDLVLSCETRPGCAACCNECKALSCDEIIARHNCPNR